MRDEGVRVGVGGSLDVGHAEDLACHLRETFLISGILRGLQGPDLGLEAARLVVGDGQVVPGLRVLRVARHGICFSVRLYFAQLSTPRYRRSNRPRSVMAVRFRPTMIVTNNNAVAYTNGRAASTLGLWKPTS